MIEDHLLVDLVIFDVDGTLTATNDVDTRCFARAFSDVFGFHINSDWQSYPHRTDSGIMAHNFREHFRRGPVAAEVERFKERSFALLEDAWRAAPENFAEITGAGRALGQIERSADYAVALATGGWKVSARFKLGKAGVLAAHLPAAFADDAHSRDEIARFAIARAAVHHQRSFGRVILLGDSDCDVATSARMNLSFVGIAADGQDTMLRAAGAQTVLPDYGDFDNVMAAIETARPPGMNTSGR